MHFRLTAGTDVGRIRTNNEDNFIVCSNVSSKEWFVPQSGDEAMELDLSGCVLAVADGMGGMNAGEVASAIAVDIIKQRFSEGYSPEVTKSHKEIEKFLKNIVTEADRAIKEKVGEDSATSGMGTTVVLAWVLDGFVHIVWCGDSRAYLFNPGSGLIRLTKDHSYVQQLVDSGQLDPELAFDHPDSNIITRSLGDCAVKAVPDYMSRQLSPRDLIILCSDGLCGLCRDEEMLHVLTDLYGTEHTVEKAKATLIDIALEAGGYDNVTVALFENLDEDSGPDNGRLTFNDFEKSAAKKRRFRRKLIIWCSLLFILAALGIAVYYLSGLGKGTFAEWSEMISKKIQDMWQ